MNIKDWWSHRSCVFFMRFTPVINTIALVAHIAFLLAGKDYYYAEILAGAPLLYSMMLYSLSRKFHFCKLHRAMLCYDFAVELCILLQWLDAFKHTVCFFRWFMLVAGGIILLMSTFKLRYFIGYE